MHGWGCALADGPVASRKVAGVAGLPSVCAVLCCASLQYICSSSFERSRHSHGQSSAWLHKPLTAVGSQLEQFVFEWLCCVLMCAALLCRAVPFALLLLQEDIDSGRLSSAQHETLVYANMRFNGPRLPGGGWAGRRRERGGGAQR
jgi:hypothetical protein